VQAFRVNPKHALFAFIALMLAYVLYHNEHFLIDKQAPAWRHYRIIGHWLLPHGLAGATALLLGISQFSTRLRTRYPQLHRVLGRCYLIAVSVVAPLGAYIQYLDEEQLGDSRSFTFAAITFASLWLWATWMAFWCIRTRRIEQHRQWMSRSLAMALVFLEVRVIEGVTGWETLGPAVDATVVWACVALGYPLADTVLQIQELLARRVRAAPRAVRTGLNAGR
jgi:uncharacterized membrane protein